MIVCGWCSNPTKPGRCSHCGRDPVIPWLQRNEMPPNVPEPRPGRPDLDPDETAQRLREARKELGGHPTHAALADHLDISVKTLNRWLKVAR